MANCHVKVSLFTVKHRLRDTSSRYCTSKVDNFKKCNIKTVVFLPVERNEKFIHEKHKILVVKRERQRNFGRPRCKWEDNIKVHLESIDCEVVLWICLAQVTTQCQALVNVVMTSWATISFSRTIQLNVVSCCLLRYNTHTHTVHKPSDVTVSLIKICK
jgi:hypothetical protein